MRRHQKKEYDDTDQGNDSRKENIEENLSDEDFIVVDHDYEMPGEINEESCGSEIVSDSDTDIENQEIQSCSAKLVENIIYNIYIYIHGNKFFSFCEKE